MFSSNYDTQYAKKFTSVLLIFLLCTVTVPFALANEESSYKIELVVKDGKDSKETDSVLTIKKTGFAVLPDKKKFKDQAKEFSYENIKVADYSYSKKPMLSGGGAIATALLVGFIFAIPFLFIKKKNHWLSVQTENEFVVMKLDGSNYRQIVAEFETHGVKVNTVNDEEKKSDK